MINYIGVFTLMRKEVERFLKRVLIQTVITPWISALLYIFIFGYVVGRKIDLIGGFSYIDFVLPGILMMNVMMSAFAQTSSSVYFQRFTKNIEEMLVAPFSYTEMILGYVFGGIARGLVVGLGIFVIAIMFSAANIAHFWLFCFYIVAISVIFSFLGIIVGVWANGFEQLNILNTFVIMPLSFLGGVFNSIHMLPESMQTFVRLNPFFYFIDGIRYSMIGVSESNLLLGTVIILALIFGFLLLIHKLFKSGYGLRQ